MINTSVIVVLKLYPHETSNNNEMNTTNTKNEDMNDKNVAMS